MRSDTASAARSALAPTARARPSATSSRSAAPPIARSSGTQRSLRENCWVMFCAKRNRTGNAATSSGCTSHARPIAGSASSLPPRPRRRRRSAGRQRIGSDDDPPHAARRSRAARRPLDRCDRAHRLHRRPGAGRGRGRRRRRARLGAGHSRDRSPSPDRPRRANQRDLPRRRLGLRARGRRWRHAPPGGARHRLRDRRAAGADRPGRDPLRPRRR